MRAHRRGFTLVEVLLAAAVGGTLMFGLFGALDLSARYGTVGRDQVRCDRIANAVARYFEKIVREAPPGIVGKTDSALAPEVSRRPLPTNRAEEPESDAVLLAGNSTTLVAAVRDAPPSNSKGRASRFARVVSTESLRTDVLPGPWGARTVSGDLASPSRVGPLSTALLREAEPASSFSRSRWEVENVRSLSEDVSRLSFRYFDGRTWATSWDGDGRGRLQAVEVSFIARAGSIERPVRMVIPTPAGGGRR